MKILQKIRREVRDWHERDIKRQIEYLDYGYIDDQKKLAYLKSKLFEQARIGITSQDLIDAIDSITHSMECERRQWFINFSNGAVNFGVNTITFLVAVNLLSLPFCNNSQSKFCKHVHYVPDVVTSYFSEPKDHTVPPLNSYKFSVISYQ